jgi:hypothetical protein
MRMKHAELRIVVETPHGESKNAAVLERASSGRGWPWGSQVSLGVTDGLVDLQMALSVAGDLAGSEVVIGGRGRPLGVAVDLGGSW